MRVRLAVVGAMAALAGCGHGPRHLSKADYQHGKSAFEMLERFQNEHLIAFHNTANEQIEEISRRNLELAKVLANYDQSILMKAGAQSALIKVQLDAVVGDGKEQERLAREQTEAAAAVSEIEPVVKICHDDAAQFFDSASAATNTCEAKLLKFRMTRKF